MYPGKRQLQVFLCHASQDKPSVRDLCQRLAAETWIEPWLDEEKLLPGQDWNLEIEKAVEAADVVIVCLSTTAVSKEGFVQRELKFVLDIALEKPEGTIFVVPLRLDDCELPRILRSRHFVDYFPTGQHDLAYGRLLEALNLRLSQLRKKEDEQRSREKPEAAQVTPRVVKGDKVSVKEILHRLAASVLAKGSGKVDVGGSIVQISYFALVSLDALGASDDTVQILMGGLAILAGITFLVRKQIPASPAFKVSAILFMLAYGLDYRLEVLAPIAPYIAGLAALSAAIILALTVRLPKKPVFYASISFAIFLLLAGFYEIATNFENVPALASEANTLMLIASILTTLLLWRDL